MSNLLPVDQIQTMANAVAKSGLFGVKTPEQAMALHGLIREAYEDQGFEIIPVPVLPIAQRADFVISHLA